jgi:cytochrome c
MKRVLVCVTMIAVLAGFVCVSYAGTDDDVKELALKSAALIKKDGKTKGIAEIMDPSGPLSALFKKGKYNVAGNDFDGVNIVNRSFPAIVGQNHYALQDANGKRFIQDAVGIAKTKGGGWIEFAWTDPDTKKIGNWRGWVQRVEGMDMLVMGLVWKPKP